MQNAIERLDRAQRLEATLESLNAEAWGSMSTNARALLESAQTDASIEAENALLALDKTGNEAA